MATTMNRAQRRRAKKAGLVPRPGREGLVDIAYAGSGGKAEFIASLFRIWVYDQEHGGHVQGMLNSPAPYIPAARNECCRLFLERDEADWLFFVDNDMIVPPDTIAQLLARADPVERPIVAALYATFMSDHGDVRALPTWMLEADGKPMIMMMEVPEGDLLIDLHGCGMGCTIIHRSVLEAVAEAHAEDDWKWFAHDLRTFDPELGPKRCGEDVTFCCRARDLGFKVTGATAVRAGHIKAQILTEKDILPALRIVAK